MSDLPARKRYYSNIPDAQKRAEWCPQLWGFNGVVIPQHVYNATNALTDYGASGASEYLATESMCAEAMLYGLGTMHGTSDVTVTKELFEVLRDAELEDSTALVPFDATTPLASSTDGDVKISGWRFGSTRLVLVVVNRSDTSKVVPVRITTAMAGTEATILHSSTGLSNAEGRTLYTTTIEGADSNWNVGVALRGFTIIEVTGVVPTAASADTGGVKRYTPPTDELRRYA